MRLVGTKTDNTKKTTEKANGATIDKKGQKLLKIYAAKTQGLEVNPTGEGREGKKQCPSMGLPRLLP